MYIHRNRLSKQMGLMGLLFISFRNNNSTAYLIVQDVLLRLPPQMRPIDNRVFLLYCQDTSEE